MAIIKNTRKTVRKATLSAHKASNSTSLPELLPREETSRKLSQLRNTFYAMFHANPIPTALVRAADDLFINVNMAFLKYFNLQLQQVLGHTARELNLGMDFQQRTTLLARLRREGLI